MSKAYAKTRAEEKKKNSSASSQKKDKFQQAYEQGTEIYNQNRQDTIQEVRRLQQGLDATSGIAGKTETTARAYLDNLAAYRARLASLGMYGADVGKAYSQAGKSAAEVRSWLPALQQQDLERARQREIQAARNRRPWVERVGLVDPNEAEMTFGVYDPSASERGRLSNVAAAGGRGWLAGQANALGFALDPVQPDEAEMFFGKAPTSKLGEKISKKINQGLFNESQRLYGAADRLNAQAQENEAAAREGLGKIGNVLVDAGVAGTQMLLDAGLGRATGTGMASMGTRTFGQSAREALDSGASYQQAMDYGALSAAVEVGTEKMFDVGKVFGKGAGDELIEAWIAKHGKTAAGTTILRMIAGMGSEGLEEVVSSAVNPILRSGFDPDALKDYRTREYWADVLNEGLVGALLGGVGVAGNVITGGNARMRAEVEQRALDRRLERANTFEARQRDLYAGNTMQTGTADAEAQRVLNRNSGTVGESDKAAVRTAAKQQYGAQARAVESVYESGTADAETFLRQFETAYNLGREGANIETAMNTPATAGLNEQQRRNAWLIGRDVGVQAGEITEDTSGTPGSSSPTEIGGAQNNGEAVRVRGSGERDAGASALGSVQQVESGTGSYQEGRSLGVGRNAEDSAAADLRYSEEVKSARDLGIENGAVIKNLRTVDESSYTPEMKQYAQEMAETGHKVTYVSGLIHAQDGPGGMITRARGMVDTNGDIFVQVDHPRFTAMQIARHEDTHARIQRGEIDLQKAKDAVRQSLGEEEYKRAVYDYASAYAGIDMTDDEAFEEIVCDAEGGMNIFEGTALKKEYDRNARITEAARKAVRENAGEQKAAGTRAPPEGGQKMSRETDSEGNALTDQQAAFFADSKVRTDSGALKVMYRGGNTDIEVFDRRKSKPSNLYGRGFYFTDSKEHAGQYGNATAYYLNITNPLSPGQHEITRAQMRAFLEAVQENDEDYDFVNYGQGATINSVLSDLYGKGDMEMLQDVNATAIGDFAAAIELFNEVNGTDYDGIIVPTETVTFRSEQIKRTDNKKPTANPNVKFSMEAPVEETDRLIAWHNMSVDALNGALELGGLAMPSWAIQPANKAHTQYGDVSVIAPRELVDPKRNRNSMIFGGDAWTPVFPEVNYKVSYEAAEALEDEIKALVGEDVYRQISGAALDKDNIADQFKRSNGRLSGHYANNLLLKYAYLKSTGSDIEAPTKEDNLYYGGDFTNEDVRRFVGRLTNGKRTLEKLKNMSVDELFEQDDLLQAIADVRYESYREKMGAKDRILAVMEKEGFFSKEKVNYTTIDRMLKAARKYLDGGVQQTVDKKALQEIIDREVDQSAYETWILQKLNDTVERKGIRNNKDLFTPSGNRRSFDQLNYAYTLANIVKAMKAQPKQGRAQFLSGPGSVRGAAMKSYKDIEQVRSEIGRVIDPENYSEAPFNEYNENLSNILDRMTKNGDKFDAADAVIEILQHAKTESGIYNYMQRELKDWYNVSPEIAHDIYELIGQVNALPIPYFEGKTYDAVRLDEALAIVVPDTINADLKQRLEDAGANVREYKAGDEADRLRVVNSVEGAKFSREDNLSELRQENRALRRETDVLTKAVQKWKRETKRTERYSAREEDVRRSAKDLIRTLNSTADAAEVTADIKALAEYIMNGENSEAASWLTVREMADRIADKVVGAEQVNIRGDVFNEYQRLTEILKGKTLHIDPEAVPDLAGYENLQEFNRANMGTMRLSAKEMKPGDKSVQDAYYEMIEAMPGWFPEDASTDAERVANMLEVLDGLRPVYGMSDETSYHYDEAVTWAANDIIDRVLDESIRQMPKTFADRAQAKLDKERARLYQRISEVREQSNERLERAKRKYAARSRAATDRMRQRQEKQIADLKARQKAKEKNARERREENAGIRKYRERVERTVKTLTDWLQTNSDKEHIPEGIKKPLVEFLSTIDFTSKRALRGGEQTAKDQKYLSRMEALQEILTRQLNYQDGLSRNAEDVLGGYLDITPEYMEQMQAHIDAVKAILGGEADVETGVINRMSAAELQDLDHLLTTLKRAIQGINKLTENARYQSVIEAAKSTMDELGQIREDGGETGKLRSFFMWDNTTPFYAFKRFGAAASSMFEALQNGWDKFAFNVKEIMEFTRETYSTKQVREWARRTQEFTLENGETVTMTPAQIMTLYEVMKQEDAVRHAQGGGVRIGNIERRGKKTIQQTAHHHFSERDLQQIFGALTDEQKRVADKLQKYMQDRGSEWGNEVSMKRYGYKAFGVDHYFPIQTEDRVRDIRTPGEEGNDLYRLLNISATKGRLSNANNALIVRDIFDVFADHMTDMAKYNSLALPILDATKWINYRERTDVNEGGFETQTVQRSIERAFGENALRYYTTFMKDLNGKRESTGRGEDLPRKMISNYKMAAVGANLRVVLLQPTAYVRAIYALNGRQLAIAPFIPGALKEMDKYSGIAAWKSLGYYDTNIARGVREQIKHAGGFKEKLQEASMKGAELSDRLTWGALWNACKLDVKARNKGLDGEALMQKTAEKFREVVYSTQVVDSTMTRSHNMRATSLFGSMATAFMAEPTLSYNLMLDAYSDYSKTARSTNRSEAWKKTRGKMAKAFTVYTASALASAIVESIADAFRDDDEYETFMNKFMEALLGEPGFKGRLNSNLVNDLLIFNKIPIIKDAISVLSGYGADRLDVEWISNALKAYSAIAEKIQLANGDLEKPTKTTYFGKMTWYGAVFLGLKTLSQATGLPVSGLTREAITIWNSTAGQITGDKVKTYDASAKSQIQKGLENGYLSEDRAAELLVREGEAKDADKAYWMVQEMLTGNKKYDAIVEAAVSGDNKAFNAALQELKKHGVSEKDAISNVKSAVGKMYKGSEDEEPSISRDQAIRMLTDYAGMKKEDAEKAVDKWTLKRDTGYDLSDMRSAFVEGDVSESELRNALTKYGGKTDEEAEKAVRELEVQKEFGIEYGVQNVQEAVASGELSEADARTIWTEYGGKSDEDADELIAAANFKAAHSDVDLDDVTASRIQIYEQYAPVGTDAAQFMSYAAQIRKDQNAGKYPGIPDGKGGKKPYSVMDAVAEWINSLPISGGEKTALLLTYTNGKTTSLSRYNWS